MPAFCAVVGCCRRAERDQVRFFKIPKALKNRGERLDALSKERRQSWVRALKRGNLSDTFLNNARICANHFVAGEPAKLEDKDNPDWVPSVNMGYITTKTQDEQSVTRHVRSVKRQAKRLKLDEVDEVGSRAVDNEPIAGPSRELVKSPELYEEQEGRMNANIQTELDMDYLNKLFKDVKFANRKIYALEEQVKASDLSEESFRNNDSKALYFTGFPKAEMMFQIFNSVAPYLSTKSVLSPFKQFILTLVKLRLNLPFKYLSYRFSISPSTRCWSNYKHHETVKFLIGITPQGTISYISEAWGGRTSDKFLTENCGFLNKILPGDVILADRGFLIRDSVETLKGHLEIPAFTKGKNQLDPADIESTRKIANVRIHVERIIGLLKKKFKLCQGPIPITMLSASTEELSVLDKILIVCSAFINLCPSVIPME